MSAMKEFCLWFLTELPDFLMAEPVCYFVGIAFLIIVVGIFIRIINLGRLY